MKRLNRKGFTLIELMVVIAILVVIMGIALPNITSSIERSKQKQIESKRKLIESAAELYFDRHRSYDKSKGVYVSELKREKLVTNSETEGTCEVFAIDDGDCCIKYDSGEYQFEKNGQECQGAYGEE